MLKDILKVYFFQKKPFGKAFLRYLNYIGPTYDVVCQFQRNSIEGQKIFSETVKKHTSFYSQMTLTAEQ